MFAHRHVVPPLVPHLVPPARLGGAVYPVRALENPFTAFGVSFRSLAIGGVR